MFSKVISFYKIQMRLSILLIALIISNFISAQTEVKISGIIPAFANQTSNLQYYTSPYKADLDQIEITLDASGKFSAKVFIVQDQMVNLFMGSDILRFHIAPGDSLYLNVKHINGTRTQTFSGRGAKEAAWYELQKKQFQNSFESADFTTKLLEEMGRRNPEQFKSLLDSITNTKTAFLLKNKKGLNEAFVNWQTAEIKFENEAFKINYPTWYYSMRGIENKELKVDSSYYFYLKNIPLNQPAYLNSTQYCVWLKYCFMRTLRTAPQQMDAVQLYDYCANFYSGEVLNKFRLMLWSDIMQYGQMTDASLLYERVKKELGKNPGFDLLEMNYREKLPFAPGAAAFPFTLKSIEGKQISLSDFIGKVVYIDFWASWCGPCKREIPAAEDLKKYFEGKDVVFLNISIDEDANRWKEAVASYQINGINLLSNSQNNPMVLENYKISTIPAYYLIGKDGKFIAAPAVRPSNGQIYQLIEAALK